MATSNDIGWIMEKWADWKLCRPKPVGHDEPRVIVHGLPFESKPPKNVWMTPAWEVRDFRAIDAAYEGLPAKPPKEGDEHFLIRLYYLWQVRPLSKIECARAMGIHHPQAWERLRLKALGMIAERAF